MLEVNPLKIDPFSNLNTEVVLSATEATGAEVSGRVIPLNSMENRVFRVEVRNPSQPNGFNDVIVKFYRPKRWSVEEILSEHLLQITVADHCIPSPEYFAITDSDVAVTSKLKEQMDYIGVHTLGFFNGYHFCVMEKLEATTPQELTQRGVCRIGETIAKMHNAFEEVVNRNNFLRRTLNTQAFGIQALKNLKKWNGIPPGIAPEIYKMGEQMIQGIKWIDSSIDFIPVHGDLHRLNMMQSPSMDEMWLIDFDDCMWAPDIQDLWLLASGTTLTDFNQGDHTQEALKQLIHGYQRHRMLPADSEILVEPLRTIRMLTYLGWIAKRWNDPLFPSTFPYFTEQKFWEKTLMDMVEQKAKLLKDDLLDAV